MWVSRSGGPGMCIYSQRDSDTGGLRTVAPYPNPRGNWLHAAALDFNEVEGEVDGIRPASFCKTTHRRRETLKFFSGSLSPEESRTGGKILR